jgi:hypothetical protein
MFESEGIGGNAHIVWGGVISNFVIFILSSFLLGLIFRIGLKKLFVKSMQ